MIPQPLDCVCRSCSAVFAVPIVALCPKCKSVHVVRVTVVGLSHSRPVLPPQHAVKVLERLASFTRQSMSERSGCA